MRRDMNAERCKGPWFGRKIFYAVLTLALGMGGSLQQDVVFAAGPEILTPKPSSTIIARNPETHLVLRSPAGAGQPQVEADGKKLAPMLREQDQGNDYIHFRLPLKRGANLFVISPGGIRLELNYQPLLANLPKSLGKDVYLFHRDDTLPQGCTACHDLKSTSRNRITGIEEQESCASCHGNIVSTAVWKHGPQTSNLCLTCHQQSLTPWRIGFPTGKIEENCLACHTGKRLWRTKKHVHGPMNVGGCTVCHNPHGDKYRYQLWAEGSGELCITCHGDKEIKPGEKKPARFVHGIISGSGCVACHDPHATDHPFMLHKPINELCVGCHPVLAGVQRGHPVSGHPVAAPAERRRPGRTLGCSSCHDPHGSPFRDLLIASNVGGQLCKECHK